MSIPLSPRTRAECTSKTISSRSHPEHLGCPTVYRRILVPLDGTPEAEAALAPARTLATALSAEVVLISVVPTGGASPTALESPDLRQAHHHLAGGGPGGGF